MSYKLTNKTKFSRLLNKHNITITAMVQHAKDMGYAIDKMTVSTVVNHNRDFMTTTGDLLIEILNDLTGEEYTFDDIHEPFLFK